MESIRRHEHYLALRLGLKPGDSATDMTATESLVLLPALTTWVTMWVALLSTHVASVTH
jgi:hypothetical protein